MIGIFSDSAAADIFQTNFALQTVNKVLIIGIYPEGIPTSHFLSAAGYSNRGV